MYFLSSNVFIHNNGFHLNTFAIINTMLNLLQKMSLILTYLFSPNHTALLPAYSALAILYPLIYKISGLCTAWDCFFLKVMINSCPLQVLDQFYLLMRSIPTTLFNIVTSFPSHRNGRIIPFSFIILISFQSLECYIICLLCLFYIIFLLPLVM